jgi:DNA modification methylase
MWGKKPRTQVAYWCHAPVPLIIGTNQVQTPSFSPKKDEVLPLKNALYYGDNLELLRNPKFVRDESIDLCYIDPPFNSERRYNQIYNNEGYEDIAQAQAFVDIHTWDEHAIKCYDEIRTNDGNRYTEQTIELIKGFENVLGKGPLLAYVVCMTARIVEIQRVLKPTGSFYLHCDPTSSHYLKLATDSVFLPLGGDFLNEIVWKRTSSHGGAKRWGDVHDTILFYSKSNNYIWNRLLQPYDPAYVSKKYRQSDERGPFMDDNLTGAGVTQGDSGKAWKGINPTSIGRHWAVPQKPVLALVGEDRASKMSLAEKLDLLDENSFILWPKTKKKDGAGLPRFKRYLGEGLSIQDVVTDIFPVNSQAKERIGYPTQKPIALLERIIKASTNEGDVILDAYCGCGTTIAAAQRFNRHWVGMDITAQAMSTIYIRLEDEFPELDLHNIAEGGAPRDMKAASLLAHKRDDRLRKEFEKWAILTYCNHKAVIHEKKGGDKGIDGITYIIASDNQIDKMVLQVKSGAVTRGDISKLQGDMGEAKLAALITLENPSRGMIEKANSAGSYTHELTGRKCPTIRIVTIEEMLAKKPARLELPQSLDALKNALRALEGLQMKLNLQPIRPEEPEMPQKKTVASASRELRKDKREPG